MIKLDTQTIKPLIDSVIRLAIAQNVDPLEVVNTFTDSDGGWAKHLRDDFPLFKELMISYLVAYENTNL